MSAIPFFLAPPVEEQIAFGYGAEDHSSSSSPKPNATAKDRKAADKKKANNNNNNNNNKQKGKRKFIDKNTSNKSNNNNNNKTKNKPQSSSSSQSSPTPQQSLPPLPEIPNITLTYKTNTIVTAIFHSQVSRLSFHGAAKITLISSSSTNSDEEDDKSVYEIDVNNYKLTPTRPSISVLVPSNISPAITIGLTPNSTSSLQVSIEIESTKKYMDSTSHVPELTFWLYDIDKSPVASVVKPPDSWGLTISKINPPLPSIVAKKIMITGSKGLGKSTFLRLLLNHTLTSTLHSASSNKILVLDLDVGQGELSPPGCMGLYLVEVEEVEEGFGFFGPSPVNIPITTTTTATSKSTGVVCLKRYFFGDVTSKGDVERYLQGCGNLMHCYNTYISSLSSSSPSSSPQLIINCDGYIKSLGYDILLNLIDILLPTDIIQLLGSSRGKVFDLTNKVLAGRKIWSLDGFEADFGDEKDKEKEKDKGDVECNVSGAPAYNSPSSTDLRSLRLINYFLHNSTSSSSSSENTSYSKHILPCPNPSKAVQKPSFTISRNGIHDRSHVISQTLCSRTPLTIHVNNMNVHFVDNPSLTLHSDYNGCMEGLNGCIVGLCTSDASYNDVCSNVNDVNCFPCYGLGIVRSIDKSAGLIYIITPVQQSVLKANNVNRLVVGKIHIPLCIRDLGEDSVNFNYITDLGVTGGAVIKAEFLGREGGERFCEVARREAVEKNLGILGGGGMKSRNFLIRK